MIPINMDLFRIARKLIASDISLEDFDAGYFDEVDGGWIAIGQGNCKNIKYFTALDDGKKVGIIGVYDTDDDKNITHTVTDPKFRGQGLAAKLKKELMKKLGLDFITLTIDLDNTASLKATEKLPGVERVSDEQYEKDFHKAKYIYKSNFRGDA
jgi:RimJ/RimL family protein N-acetyltransferase